MVAWALVNTVYAFKYARMYFVDHHGSGFDFNQDSSPTYSDFAYLAFTIGMSYGVSEVEPDSEVRADGPLSPSRRSSTMGPCRLLTRSNR